MHHMYATLALIDAPQDNDLDIPAIAPPPSFVREPATFQIELEAGSEMDFTPRPLMNILW